MLVWFGPAQVAGRFVHAVAGGRPRLRVLGFVAMAAVPASLLVLAFGRTATLIAFAVVFDVASGLVTIVRGGLLPDHFGRAQVGRIGGAMSAAGLVTRAGAPWLAALLLATVDDYRGVVVAPCAVGLAAAFAFAAAGRPAPPPG